MKRRSPIHAYKRLLANDHDWDYGYLIAVYNTWLHQSFSGEMKSCCAVEQQYDRNAVTSK